MGGAAARAFEAELVHRIAELLTVFGLVDDLSIGPDHLDAIFGQGAVSFERQSAVQRGLAAHGGQKRVWAFLFDDLGDDLRGDRLDIGRVGHVGIGHDRGGIGIDQHDPIALSA